MVYLDRSLAPGGGSSADGSGHGVHVDMHDFVPEGCSTPAQPRVHLLYRPGHYVSGVMPARCPPRRCFCSAEPPSVADACLSVYCYQLILLSPWFCAVAAGSHVSSPRRMTKKWVDWKSGSLVCVAADERTEEAGVDFNRSGAPGDQAT